MSPSKTRVKLVARHLAQQTETGIRQTGNTTANSPCNPPLQTQQSRPPYQTVQRTAAAVCGVVIPPPSSFSTQSVRAPTIPAHIFFLRKKIPASHSFPGGTPTVSLALGTNHKGKKRVVVKSSRIQSSRIGSALVCVCRNVQHHELKLPKSTRFTLITAVMAAVPTGGPTDCLVRLPPLFSQNTQSHEKSLTSLRAQDVSPAICLALGANREGKERVKCVRWNTQHREGILPKFTPFVLDTILKVSISTCGPTGVRSPPLSPQNIQSHEKSPTSFRARDEALTMSLALGTNPGVKERVKGKASRVQSSRIGSSLVCVHRNTQHLKLKTSRVHTIRAHCCSNGCCDRLWADLLPSKSFSPLVPKRTVTRKIPHKP